MSPLKILQLRVSPLCSMTAKSPDLATDIFSLVIRLPNHPFKSEIMVSTQEQVADLRSTIMESPETLQYSCFHLKHDGKLINDYGELSEVEGFAPGSELVLSEAPYTEKESRMHLLRTREIIGLTSDRTDSIYGIASGLSLHDDVCPWTNPEPVTAANGNGANSAVGTAGNVHAMDDFKLDSPPDLRALLPQEREGPPKTVKALGVSAWNPPPPFLRQQGHLLYLLLTTNEGDQYHLTCQVSGFFVNKSSNAKFDPFPRTVPKKHSAHSLLTLITDLSPSFHHSFASLQDVIGKRDPLASYQVINAVPSCPWMVTSSSTSLPKHESDLTRTQETYLMSGAENTESLRDWNEEIQSMKEMPRETVQDRIFRERMISKTYVEFNEAAARGAVLVARGEVTPLNPTDTKDAQIFVWNNIFYSLGVDGVGTFASEGGDEAARVAVAKDVAGVKLVNNLDIDKLASPGTIVVDYMGRRLVAQSIVPGIFRQREENENQVDYGGVEGKDTIADNEAFVPLFAKVAAALKVKKHLVWDKEGKEHSLEASVETKGLLGTDGRKYILDLYRTTPLDVMWLEKHRPDAESQDGIEGTGQYPHRMVMLRQELVDLYWQVKLKEHIKERVEDHRAKTAEKSGSAEGGEATAANGAPADKASVELTTANGALADHTDKEEQDQPQVNGVVSAAEDAERDFSLAFNPDVFCGQLPQSDSQKLDWENDEADVRNLGRHLHEVAIPNFIDDIKEARIGFPLDGHNLTTQIHKHGINVRYLGHVATLSQKDDRRLQALAALAIQEMIARSFKHIANRYLKNLSTILISACLTHLLNCLLGAKVNDHPIAEVPKDAKTWYPDSDLSFTKLAPESLRSNVMDEVKLRYRFDLPSNWADQINHVPLLRSVALKLGIQLTEKDYRFLPTATANAETSQHAKLEANQIVNGATINGATASNVVEGHNGTSRNKKKKKNAGRNSPTITNGVHPTSPQTTFVLDDVVNTVPIVKTASPKARLAEETLDGCKIAMMNNQREIGHELMVESLNLHEQIYGVLHPEVAHVYHSIAMLFFQYDEKRPAIELAHKAVIIYERTLGIDASETIHAYLNLALFEHGDRNTAVALTYVRHALELWKIVYGGRHPDSATTISSVATMLQSLHSYHRSRLWYEICLEVSIEFSGRNSMASATMLFQLAQALVLDGDHKGGVAPMREAYTIYALQLGADHPNTKEAETWLENLTSNAVSMAKHAKDLQAKRIRRLLLHPRPTQPSGPNSISQSAADLTPSQQRVAAALDTRSIDELVKAIEGRGDVKKSKPPKKRTTRTTPPK